MGFSSSSLPDPETEQLICKQSIGSDIYSSQPAHTLPGFFPTLMLFSTFSIRVGQKGIWKPELLENWNLHSLRVFNARASLKTNVKYQNVEKIYGIEVSKKFPCVNVKVFYFGSFQNETTSFCSLISAQINLLWYARLIKIMNHENSSLPRLNSVFLFPSAPASVNLSLQREIFVFIKLFKHFQACVLST